MVFDDYANYYDLLYQDKDYAAEANYINTLIKKYNSKARNILDLGCGTGKHAELLSKKGYKVHGIDLSPEMLKQAKQRAAENQNLSFSENDIQEYQINQTFDVITALFHVISYQTTQTALEKVMKNVYEHLNTDGIFIFDCWYGPAVLSEKPEVRVKRLENETIEITRIAEPVLRENENIVEVNYDVFIKDKRIDKFLELKEKHIMRYLFKNEVRQLMKNNAFTFMDCFEFMSNKEPGKDTWGVCFVGRK